MKAVLDEAVLYGADLVGADLGSAEMWAVDARRAGFRSTRLDGASLLECQLQGADLSNASTDDTSFKVTMDATTLVSGLHGVIFGPARVTGGDGVREMDGPGFQHWLNSRGARVEVR